MSILVAFGVFVMVSLAVFLLGLILDQRNARARLLRERLATVDKAAERQPSEELALLRDEMLSEIPALDNLLRRSDRVSALQKLLSQADVPTRAGNFLLLCLGSAVVLGGIVFVAAKQVPIFAWVGFLL